ncbi:unnamed protein product, partial [Symbiodinium necroappetens]
VDIIGVYQFAFLQKAGMTDAILDQRRRLLGKLDRLLASLPVRSQLIVGGDFNATLVPTSRIAGYGLLQRALSDKEKADQDLLLRLLQKYKLSALNTWGKKSGAATYLHAKGRSQIDFVYARQAVSDGEAKQTRPEFTVMAGWRSTGHLPLVGSIPHRWTPWAKPRRERQAPVPEGPGLEVLAQQNTNEEPCSIQELRGAVLRAECEAPEPMTRPGLEPVDELVKGCWKLRRKRQIAQTLLGAGFIFVFRVQRIRLRDEEGNLMSGPEECRVLAAYARDLFMAPEGVKLPLLRIPEQVLKIEAWQKAAVKLKAVKAAPHDTPPLRQWKQHCQLI